MVRAARKPSDKKIHDGMQVVFCFVFFFEIGKIMSPPPLQGGSALPPVGILDPLMKTVITLLHEMGAV